MKNLILFLFLISSAAFADSIDVGLIGISSHGILTDSHDWQNMKRRISKTGYVVWNPELNLTYEHHNWLLNASWIDDCFGKSAYYVGGGYKWDITKSFSASLMGGFFFNHDYHYRIASNGTIANYESKSKITFLPLVSLEKTFMFNDHFGAFINVSSNYALTHAFTGLRVEL